VHLKIHGPWLKEERVNEVDWMDIPLDNFISAIRTRANGTTFQESASTTAGNDPPSRRVVT
jgi:hypothetical protein